MREVLPIGTIVPINGKDYRISGVIGEGASCVVYDASAENEFGAIRKYRLKECYPHNVPCHRDGNQLIWEDATQQAAAFSRFKKSINILSALRDERSLGNYFTEPEPHEANGTLYAVMPVNYAKTYDKEQSADLQRILRTILKLTRIVSRLHSYGYLHLDIKPENFLVEYDPEPNIWLFDVDSMRAVDELRNGCVSFWSYSEKWAAPELSQRKTNKVCYATDLYSIGAILFQKVMGRHVSNDDIGLFAVWDFDGELFDDVNPKIQRYLSEIFKKTLSATVKCRYQQADELVSALEQALDVLGKPYLLSNVPDNSCGFVGRGQAIVEIQRALDENKHIVFLTGIGGIGKSELAKRFGNIQQKNYDAVVYAPFDGSVEELLLDIEIQNFDGDEHQQNKQINRLLDKNVLLIIDNMDTEDAPGLERLSRLKCDILITSRLEWQEYSFPVIKVGSLSQEEQFSLFLYECGGVMNLAQRQAVFSILSAVEGYTLLIPLIAKQVRKGNSSVEEIADKVQTAGIKAASAGKVRHLKDGTALSGSVYGILREVLDISSFSEDEKNVVRSLSLLSKYQISQTEFLRWIGQEYSEPIDDLVFSGWIYRGTWRGNTVLFLHSVISQLYIEELKPSLNNCQGIRNHMLLFADSFAQWHKNPTSYYYGGYAPTNIRPNDQYQLDSYLRMMEGILVKCDWSNPDNIVFWLLIIEKIANVISGDFSIFVHFLIFVIEAGLNALDEVEEPLPRVSYAALAMEAIALQQDNLEEALLYANHVVETISSVKDPEDCVFQMCFHFYQWICLRNLDFEEYWNIPGFGELSEFVRYHWNKVIEAEVIGFDPSRVCVLNNRSIADVDIDVDEAIEQAFKDYCYKISPTGIEKAQKDDYDSLDDISDLLAAADKAADKACDIYGLNIPRSGYVDAGEELTEEELELSRFVHMQQELVNSMLHCKVDNPMGLWLAMNPQIKSDREKEELRGKLLQTDTMMQVHIPSVDGRTVFAYELAKMEAAFSYAYAVAEEWDRYCFHSDNLLAYYQILITGKRFLKYFRSCTITDINQLPGLASLLNKYGKVLPAARALELLSKVIGLMEQYHISEKLPANSLFEVYTIALDYAEKAKDSIAIIHFQKRINQLSSVHFSEKSSASNL